MENDVEPDNQHLPKLIKTQILFIFLICCFFFFPFFLPQANSSSNRAIVRFWVLQHILREVNKIVDYIVKMIFDTRQGPKVFEKISSEVLIISFVVKASDSFIQTILVQLICFSFLFKKKKLRIMTFESLDEIEKLNKGTQ